MKLNTLQPNAGSKTSSKRLWRGNGSGKGTFAGKGCKGQNARSGGWVRPGFEWGQTPLFRRMPKNKGFSNFIFKKEYNTVTLDIIAKAAAKWHKEIDVKVLLDERFVSLKNAPLKVLGSGKIEEKITVKAAKFTAWAKQAIEKAGWKAEIMT